MRQLVTEHPLQLIGAQGLEDAGGDGDGGVLGVAAGGEGVGLGGLDDVDAWHRHLGPGDQGAHDGVDLG